MLKRKDVRLQAQRTTAQDTVQDGELRAEMAALFHSFIALRLSARRRDVPVPGVPNGDHGECV